MKRITVAVSVYNGEQYLEPCLQSVLGQTASAYDVVLVDDGSTDRSGEICDFFAAASQRVRVAHQPNNGVYAARSAALGLCRTPYIWFVDADDLVEGTAIAALNDMLDAREAQGEPLPELVTFRTGEFGREKPAGTGAVRELTEEDLRHLRAKNLYSDDRRALGGVNAAAMWATLYSCALLRKISLPELYAMRTGEDLLANAAAFRAATCVLFLDQVLYVNRPNPAAVSMRHNITSPQAYTLLVKALSKLLAGEPDMLLRRMYYARVVWCVREALRTCWCHPDEHSSIWDRRRAFRRFVAQGPIRDGLRRAQLRDLSWIDKGVKVLTRLHLFLLTNLIIRSGSEIVERRLQSGKHIYHRNKERGIRR